MKKLLLIILRPIKYKIQTYKLMKPYIRYIEKNLGSNGISLSKEKMRANIIKQAHILEKGLSLVDVKPWFGQTKIVSLIFDVRNYYNKYGDEHLLYFVVSMLQSYIDFNSSYDNAPTQVLEQIEDLKQLLGGFSDNSLCGGIVNVSKQIGHDNGFEFQEFASSRHSVRSFTGEPVDLGLIHNALATAETTPSACNRQPWYNYVITNKQKIDDILSVQRGSRQFKDQVSALIITSSSAHFFFEHEFNQMYFNTGLYSMTLLLALHAQGLGTIPLNLGIDLDDLASIRKTCGIPDSQMPISLIAVGVLPSNYKYAKSARFSYKDYTVFI